MPLSFVRRVRSVATVGGASSLFFILLLIPAMHTVSPVADLLATSKIVNLMLLLSVVLILLFRTNSSPLDPVLLRRVGFCTGVLLTYLFVHALLVHQAWSPDVRYLLIIVIGYLLFVKLSLPEKYQILNALTWFFTIYFFYICLVYLLIGAGVLDLASWGVKSLGFLHPESPILVRDRNDFSYFLPFYSVVIARGGGTLVDLGWFSFARLTGPFMEPSDVAYVIVPLLFYALHAARKNRLFFIAAACFSILVFWAFAASGFVAIGFSVLVYLIALAQTGSKTVARLINLLSAAFVVFLGFMFFQDADALMGVFGQHRANQFLYFKDQFSVAKDLYLSPSAFGVGFDVPLAERTYGIFAVVIRHGWVGSLILASSLLAFLYACWRLLKTDYALLGMAGIATTLLFVKYSEIVNLYYLIIGVPIAHVFFATRAIADRSGK
jgi:hypothetical protein